MIENPNHQLQLTPTAHLNFVLDVRKIEVKGCEMKKLFLAILAMAIITSTALAGDYDIVKGGATGYVSSYSGVSAFVQLRAGDNISVMNLNSAKITLNCGIGRLNIGLDKSGYDSFNYTIPATDLYMVYCIKKAGTSGDTIVAVVDASYTREAKHETPLTDEDLKNLTEKWGKKFSE